MANQQLDIAAQRRVEERKAIAELQRMVPTPIRVSPSDIVDLLRTLGVE